MDPITRAVVAALEAGRSGSSQKSALEAYQTLRTALQQKFGPESDLINAVSRLEKKPESSGWQEVLHEEILTAKADQDLYLLDLAQILLKKANQSRLSFRPCNVRPE